MATFMPPALPAGHWAAAARFPAAPTPLNITGLQTLHRAYLSAAAKIVFLYNGIPDVEKDPSPLTTTLLTEYRRPCLTAFSHGFMTF
ncbi:hypothetical protein BDZ88DRAFT_456626 [Geranomyces variabilis]|nr:hypothetical protein BDZ88DRAFT_456626 [Geranomyces variabilis]